MKLKDIPHMTVDSIKSDQALAKVRTHPGLGEYLYLFAEPQIRDGKSCCLKCKRMPIEIRWGLAHGEANCVECGWPTRYYHFFGEEPNERRVEMALQYHPDFVTKRKSA